MTLLFRAYQPELDEMGMFNRFKFLFIILLLSAGSAFAAAASFGWLHWGDAFSVNAVKASVSQMGAWGVVMSIGLMVVHSFLPFPAEVVAIANGLCFGPVWGESSRGPVPCWDRFSHSA